MARSAAGLARRAGGDPFGALGDPNRRAIVELLASGPADGRSVGDLASALPISRPAVSRHLRLLKSAGLVVEQPRGTRRLYRLHDEGLEAVRSYLERVWGEAAARFRLVAENTDPSAAAVEPGPGGEPSRPATPARPATADRSMRARP